MGKYEYDIYVNGELLLTVRNQRYLLNALDGLITQYEVRIVPYMINDLGEKIDCEGNKIKN